MSAEPWEREFGFGRGEFPLSKPQRKSSETRTTEVAEGGEQGSDESSSKSESMQGQASLAKIGPGGYYPPPGVQPMMPYGMPPPTGPAEPWEREFGFGRGEFPLSKHQRKSSETRTTEVAEGGEQGSDESSSKSERSAPFFFVWPDAVVEEKEILDLLWNDSIHRCKDVLKEYRDTKGPDYELVELVKYNGVPMPPFKRWHFNFKAKKRAVDSGQWRVVTHAPLPVPEGFDIDQFRCRSLSAADDDDDGSPKLFYADLIETNRAGRRLISLMQCEVLDPFGPAVGNCPYCKNGVLHPTKMVDRDVGPFWIPVDSLPDDYNV